MSAATPATRVVLIRHPATDTGCRLCGWYDVPLNARGLAQVDALLGREPEGPVPTALYTSTLRRATTAAAVLGARWGLEPVAVDWAREIDGGDLDGMRVDDLRRRFPDLWARNEAQDDDAFAWPGGESYRRFRARVLAGLAEVVERYPGGRIAVVTHAGVVAQVLGALRDRPPAVWSADRPEPFTATEIVWHDGAPRTVLAFNRQDWF